MTAGTALLDALPIAVYTTDAEGRITYFNEAAAVFWGQRPVLGVSQWGGAWRLYRPDGTPLPLDECPMAIALRERRILRGVQGIVERPDGSRQPYAAYPNLITDADGRVTGAINTMVEVLQRQQSEIESARLAAIVSSSDDAIISKNLEGRITSWNAGATRIFGYEADEIIGQSILRVIPPELQDEEPIILSKIQRGERIEHFDTIRLTKDGRRINISLTVSPMRDASGNVIGASKVARDVTERKKSEALQRLLFDELNHRVKNTLATIQAIASQSLRRASRPEDFVTGFTGRIQALARAHDLLVLGKMQGASVSDILREQVLFGSPEGARIELHGPAVMLDSPVAVQLALVLHELATNARKYGALSLPAGRLRIDWRVDDAANERRLHLEWQESGVPHVAAPTRRGFGTTLIERSLEANGGTARIHYGSDGITCTLSLPLPDANDNGLSMGRAGDGMPIERLIAPRLAGRRILVVEDEMLIAMEVEAHLQAAGCEVVGPAGSIEAARRLIEETVIDAALLDANLFGQPVDELAAALARRGIPFAFATGYGREALPVGHGSAPILPKPFTGDEMLGLVQSLVDRRQKQWA